MTWNWKRLILEDYKEEGAKDAPKTSDVSASEPVKFPTAGVGVAESSVTVSVAPKDNPQCQPHLEKILELYEKGFESLNKPGYDFFEFYKAILSAGAENPSVYSMALSMAKSMDNSITKEKLISDSDYYISEINKVHSGYVDNGVSKKNKLTGEKESEKQQLNLELSNLRMQLETINNQMVVAQEKLNNIDHKYLPDLTEVECKLMANDVAKEKILASIEKVKQGLIINVN